ncbi:MAG: hypothetical protein ACRDTD_25205 [Pseudonocardiaceae bacterium]
MLSCRSGARRSRRAALLVAAGVVTAAAGSGIGYALGAGRALGADRPALPTGEPVTVQAMAPQIRAGVNLVAH